MRSSGVLMPVTSLPSPWGVGTMGAEARAFVDFLAACGACRCWQVLPIGPTSYGDSPYQSFSSFAGNPYLIDLDDLASRGAACAATSTRSSHWGDDPGRVDYGAAVIACALACCASAVAEARAPDARRARPPSAQGRPPGWTTTPSSWP